MNELNVHQSGWSESRYSMYLSHVMLPRFPLGLEWTNFFKEATDTSSMDINMADGTCTGFVHVLNFLQSCSTAPMPKLSD